MKTASLRIQWKTQKRYIIKYMNMHESSGTRIKGTDRNDSSVLGKKM
jgi:hypothetical protein